MQTAAMAPPLSEQQALTVRHAWMLVVALMLSGFVSILGAVQGAHTRNDFAHYYLTANIYLSGGDPYCVPLEPLCAEHGFEFDRRIPYGTNPPLLIRLFALFAWMPAGIAYTTWAIFQIVPLVIFLEATRRVVRWGASDVRFWLLTGFVLSSTALQSHVVYSQVQLIVGAVLASAFLARLKGRHLLACGLVALAAGFKIYPAVLLPWFVLFSTPRMSDRLRRAAVVLLVFAAVFLATGPAAWISFVRNGLPVIQSNLCVASHTNYSVQAILVNGLGGLLEMVSPNAGSQIAGAVARVVPLGLILCAYLCVWRKKLSDVQAYCLLTITMVACSPVSWVHYMVLLILPVTILFKSGKNLLDLRIRYLVYGVAFLSLMPGIDANFLGASQHPMAWAIHYYPLYVLTIAAILFIRLPAKVFMTEEEQDRLEHLQQPERLLPV